MLGLRLLLGEVIDRSPDDAIGESHRATRSVPDLAQRFIDLAPLRRSEDVSLLRNPSTTQEGNDERDQGCVLLVEAAGEIALDGVGVGDQVYLMRYRIAQEVIIQRHLPT